MFFCCLMMLRVTLSVSCCWCHAGVCSLLYVVMERAGWEKYETCPRCASSYNKDCCFLLRFHLCAQQQHSILITQHLLCHSPERERRRKFSKARPKNKAALYVLWVLTSTQMTHFSISKGLRIGWKKKRGGLVEREGRQQWSQSCESEVAYKSWRVSLHL